MNSRNLALLAAFTTAIIYGISYTVAKDLMPNYIPPFALIFFRVFGGACLFWLAGLFVKRQKIQKQDFLAIAACAIFGTGFNMLCFYKGLNLTTPITAAAIAVTTPLNVLLLSVFFLKEKLKGFKILGLFSGLIGAFVLITYQSDLATVKGSMIGNFFVYLNSLFYAFYLIVAKKLLEKYHPITIVKWMYLLGIFIVFPFSYAELQSINWQSMPEVMFQKVLFVVFFATFINYLFNIFALSKLKPTTVSVFVYLQPVFAAMYALFVKSDTLSLVKVVATLFVFLGVYLVTKPVKDASETETI